MMNDDLFYWIWYTCNFVKSAEEARKCSPNKTITQIFNEFADAHPQVLANKDRFTLVNKGLIVMVAYGICVLPQQDQYFRFAKLDYTIRTKRFFRVILDQKSSMTNREPFLKRIRNSIAHGNFEFLPGSLIDDPTGMKLWDGPPKKAVNFKVEISVNNWLSFLNEIGHQFAEFSAQARF